MSIEQIQPGVPTQRSPLENMTEDQLVEFMATYEPVRVVQDAAEQMRPCAGKCGRTVAIHIALCVVCRNTSSHPAFGRR